jgi:hypothetical protein
MRRAILCISLFITACAGSPAAPSRISAEPARAMTSQALFDQLKSDEEADARSAVAAVEADPGAYLPSIFGGVARELLEAGRAEDAVVWHHFGMLRMMEDIEFAGRISDRADHMGLILMMSYQSDEGEALAARLGAATSEERRAVMAETEAMSVRYPRRYAPTWVLRGREPYEQNFAAAPIAWTDGDLAALAEVRARVRAELDAMDEAASAD